MYSLSDLHFDSDDIWDGVDKYTMFSQMLYTKLSICVLQIYMTSCLENNISQELRIKTARLYQAIMFAISVGKNIHLKAIWQGISVLNVAKVHSFSATFV